MYIFYYASDYALRILLVSFLKCWTQINNDNKPDIYFYYFDRLEAAKPIRFIRRNSFHEINKKSIYDMKNVISNQFDSTTCIFLH